MAFVMVLSSNACSDSSANQDPNLVVKETNENAMRDFGITIPVGIQKEGNVLKVSFIISAQFYEIKDSKENEAFISMIQSAVENETPVHVFLKKNSNEIAKVEKAPDEDVTYFKSIFTKETQSETSKAVSVIPNLATLNNLFTQIKNQSCGTSTASSPCITFRYAVDGCYARAHKMRQILLNAGYDCEK